MRNALHPNFLCILFAWVLLSIPNSLQATHYRAGEISIRQVGDCTESLTIEASVVTYTKASRINVDRDSVTVCWGDGQCEKVGRVNGPGVPPQGTLLENDIKRNIYRITHTYISRGSYVISMTDQNRNGGILNVNPPNSEQISFHIETRYTFPNPQFQGCNDTPVLLQDPVDIGCVGKVFTHNPAASDANDDSLSYHFAIPQQDVRTDVPNYSFPDEINAGPDNRLTIDNRTGSIVWDAPQKAGEYNLAIIIVSYRNGVVLDTVFRDMQILVRECDNEPPDLRTSIEEICVIAGDFVEIEVNAGAPVFETDQKVKLTATGKPFTEPISPATFVPESDAFEDDPVTKLFRWQTSCEHVSDQFYTVVFRAVDDFFPDGTGLATLKTVRIKVVGPPPEGVQLEADMGTNLITWELPYTCDQAADNFFQGFTVWRREGSNNFELDTCEPGLEGRGYTRLTQFPIQTVTDARYSYLDENIEAGKTYCYRILARFAQTTPGGLYSFNPVESLPSAEVCVQSDQDLPLLTKVDVLSTSTTAGDIEVCWAKPQVDDLDTISNPGPYTYEVLRATGQTDKDADFQPLGVAFTSTFFTNANDTCFIDTDLNTVENPYSYKLNFYVRGNQLLGAAPTASSIYVSVAPTNEANRLSWTALVPWDNYEYTIYRQNTNGSYDSIATTLSPSYRDEGLTNGLVYCYKVEGKGRYGIDNIAEPLINFSQEVCVSPFDDAPTCPPTLAVSNVCGSGFDCKNEEELFNTLTWESPFSICPAESGDLAGFDIYYAPEPEAAFTLIATIDDPEVDKFEHQPAAGLAGCYKILARDTLGNESEFSNTICVENCPFYDLPNAFTPNGDGQNDIYKPYPYCFISRIQFKAFNRWGQLVFETTDPDINWDGTNLNGQALASGTYYYTCSVFENRFSGTEQAPILLSGYIELLRAE